MLFLAVFDTHHIFSVFHKIIRLDYAWFGFTAVLASKYLLQKYNHAVVVVLQGE